jgi:O-acetyl-ADP-ribose deacetylase (regulator of RNase III)
LQRDQSFAPNDAYNQMISFCHYDLTRLRVDAIVNNAPGNFKAPPAPGSLHHAIFKAGGSGLRKEARSKARVKVGQAELTHGHALPSSWVIHAAAPTYTGSKGVGQFNVLSECYRSALKMAASIELKTIAFPCLGTGGCNFPPRVAARIALQEIREYLDVHPEHRPERIIFCVKAAIDEKAYTDFLPVFFPPTHGDLDRARTSNWSANRAALAAQILEARSQLQKTLINMSDTYIFRSQSTACAHDIRRVDSALTSIRNYLLGSKELKRSLGDLNLLCSVVLTACASISEIAERAKEMGFAEETQSLWNETNTDMHAKHGFDLSTLFDYCWMFANSLDDVITRDMREPDAMARARQVLESYGVKQKGQDVEGIRDHPDEVIHVRESERYAPNNRQTITVDQIQSVARLYLLGNLEAKPTMAQPSTPFNHTVCLLREDITRLGVDVMVNSTDVSFSGMGTLDRSVFKKGGSELRDHVKFFGRCKEGDVKLTPAYLLPAKHILHVIPPGQFRKDTKSVLRNVYREILHTAVLIKATSVAIPSIGTGMLNYPRRDCASLAMEEVKQFLESAEPGHGLDKIIFVVFSSSDEFIYKSLLPVYFPPTKGNAPEEPQREGQAPAEHQAATNTDGSITREIEREVQELSTRGRDARDASLPASTEQTAETREILSSSNPLAKHPDASSDSVEEASRSVRFSKSPATSRSMHNDEEYALTQFESHVNDCNICSDGLFERRHELCQQGFSLAQAISQRMEMSDDANVYSKADKASDRVKLKVPMDRLPGAMLLLSTIAQSMHTGNLKGDPFVQVTKPQTAELEDRSGDDDTTHGSVNEDMKVSESATEPPALIRVDVLPPFISRVDTWVRVHKNKLELYENFVLDRHEGFSGYSPYQSIDLTDSNFNILREDAKTVSFWWGDAARDLKETWQFRSAEAVDSIALFELLQRAVNRSRPKRRRNVSPQVEEATDSASATERRTVIRAKFFVDARNDWVYSFIHVHKSKIEIYFEDASPEDPPNESIDLATASTDAIETGFDTVSFRTDQKQAGRWSKRIWHFRIGGATTRVELFDILQQAINRSDRTRYFLPGSEVDEARHSVELALQAADSAEAPDTNPYSLWHKRLREMQDGHDKQRLSEDVSEERTDPQPATPDVEEVTDSASTVAPAAQTGDSGETINADSYPQWNQRLRDIKDEIDAKHRNEEETDPQSTARATNNTEFSSGVVSAEWRQFLRRQKLRVQILDYLANDFRTRPGSYIGQNTDSIASEINIDTELANGLLHELAAQERVHNTVDNNTWVISEQIDESTVHKPEERLAESGNIHTDVLADQILVRMNGGESPDEIMSDLRSSGVAFFPLIMRLLVKHFITSEDHGSWTLTNLGRERVLEIHALAKAQSPAARGIGSVDPGGGPPNDLHDRALSYLRSLPGMRENISELAATSHTQVPDVEPVPKQLGSDGLVENKDDSSSWTTKSIQEPPSQSPREVQTGYSWNLVYDASRSRRQVLIDYHWGLVYHSIRVTRHPLPRSHSERVSFAIRAMKQWRRVVAKNKENREKSKQEQFTTKAAAASKTSSWRTGRGANKRQQTNSSRALAEDLEQDLESSTAINLRQAKIARDRKYNKSNRALSDNIDDELEYYDGQEEDYLDEDDN